MNGEPPPGVGPESEVTPPSRVIDRSVLPMYQTLATQFYAEGVPVILEKASEQTNETGQPLGDKDVKVKLLVFLKM